MIEKREDVLQQKGSMSSFPFHGRKKETIFFALVYLIFSSIEEIFSVPMLVESVLSFPKFPYTGAKIPL